MTTGALFDLGPEVAAAPTAGDGSATQDQWRLAEIQVANWGTFDKEIHRLPIARQGHLITGPSGSGKSSLLDAIAAVLTPDKWLRFNLAAQSAGARTDQRSLVSYVRGAWSRTTDDEEDRVVSRYLRPGATWSGIVLRYEAADQKPVSLVRLFFLRGTGTSTADLQDLCLLDRSAVDLADLQEFARGGIEARKVKAALPEAVITTNGTHGKFYARLRSVFGIAHESALQLLHKTQSAKSLDSLDQLFREHMLERPGTFALADTAVEQFGELNDAHAHVVQLRLQRDHLSQLRDASGEYETARQTAEEARELATAVRPYTRRRALDLARIERTQLEEKQSGLAADVEQAEEEARSADDAFDAAQRRSLEAGGADAEALQDRIRDARDAARQTDERWESLRRQLKAAGIEQAPTTAAEFAELQTGIARTLGAEDGPGGPTHEQNERYFAALRELREIDEAIADLRRSGSTVPGNLLAVRREISAGTGLPESALPFAAELIEVRREHADWTGAIERVLRPLALTLLVRSEHIRTVRQWVDTHRIRARLVFEEVAAEQPPPRPLRSDLSLVHRVQVKEDRFGDWVAATLAERFDIACVDSPDALDDHPRAVTINGQLKSSRTRYEKDDRSRIDDRSHWVLGDREAKVEALIARRQEAQAEYEAAKQIVDEASAARDQAQHRAGVLASIREQSWSAVDRAAAMRVIADLEKRLAALTSEDSDLAAAVEAADEARHLRDLTRKEAEEARHLLRSTRHEQESIEAEIARLEAAVADGTLAEVPAELARTLEERFRKVQRSITRASLPDVGQQVASALHEEQDRARAAAGRAESAVTRLAAQFKERWPAASANLTADVADRAGFLTILEGIEAHGLPEHEARFLTMLQERSRDLIGELLSDILGSFREIEDRVDRVNESLGKSKFDEGRYLRIKPKLRRSDTVKRFIEDLRSITAGSWEQPDLDTAETTFGVLAELMRRFASSEHVDRVWRNQCLDTRLHVTFLAEEVDEAGRAHTAYDSGAALSGGQQQKLVVFCLAAALRYQLAEPDEDVSRYGTIVLDEAFDKADTRYTRMALDVFVAFGFHLVLATPQKLLQTIEPYVGAATSVENPTRQRSVVSTMEWAEDSGDTDVDSGVGAEVAVEVAGGAAEIAGDSEES